MQTPWFLDHLGLTTTADAADIKRAYAARLKQIDQATDIAGFMRLREAYAAATAWSRQANEDMIAEHAPVSVASTPSPSTAAPVSDLPLPDPRAPMNVATQAFQELEQRLGKHEAPNIVISEQLAGLQGEHLQATAIFEAMLIDGLATMRLPQRLAIFGTARDQMGWDDIVHVQQMGARGQWIRSVQQEEIFWKRTADATGCHDLFDRLGGVPTLDRTDLTPSHFSRDATLRWPDMQQLLQQYPHYLALRVERSALAAWEQAYAALPPRDKAMAESFSNLPSPAAYRQTAPARGRTNVGGRMGAVIGLVVMLNLFNHAFNSESRTPERSASTPAASAPLVSRPAFTLPEHVSITPGNCERIEGVVHEPDWAPPLDPTQLHRLRDATLSCLRSGRWPHWRIADPQLAKLGIQT
ncbi:hypothetical protein [Dyella japonica]|uniref:J domain-containing protein n=1 Tax=Dyella japonica TaxID=231455 RepID=A0ABV2JX29_9GAMM